MRCCSLASLRQAALARFLGSAGSSRSLGEDRDPVAPARGRLNRDRLTSRPGLRGAGAWLAAIEAHLGRPLGDDMRILVGCEMVYEFEQVTPVIATLNVHASRVSDLERPDYLVTDPACRRSRATATRSATGATGSSRPRAA